ncbi:glycosyltransferase family 39 protein [Nostoc sp. TCL26-01]|uniref:glycosyltransferase family 39 protein n=1 Tax=Nostoc sp. TCL26-01 TaxID=2576904 RepID=UPI0015B9FC37|nr:glycosyltransferase family 39 protein [Nostoc sp. TCL26-01]QLE54693.1 hypothetical protein FD725_03710 [Nostoc sp. TCL26-01]
MQKKSRIFVSLLIIILAMGLTFRFINLDKKSYWDDEAFTALRVSGYTEYELVEKVASVAQISINDLSPYQGLNQEKTAIDTIKSLSLEEPQHPPLYYLLSRFWVQLLGNSLLNMRMLSAVLSLLALPAVYWLCLELFGNTLTAWIAVGLLAISPFHLLYAQEAREYSLWIVTILLSSASLLRAMRLNTRLQWVIYAATVALNLYAFPSSATVILASAIYVITIEKWRLSQKLMAFFLASLAGLMAFFPWLLVIVGNLNHINKIVGGQGNMPRVALVKTWAFNLSRIFVDSNQEKAVINFGFENKFTYLIQIGLVGLLICLVGYAIYFLYRHSSKSSWLFLLTLILVNSLPIMLKDLLNEGTRSIIPRYFIPSYLGIQISVAYLLANRVSTISKHPKLWRIVMCVLFSGSIFSGTLISQADSWWTKSHSDTNLQAAKFINQAHKPLLISDGSMGRILGFSHQVKSDLQLQLKPYCHTCRTIPPAVSSKDILEIPSGFDVFLLDPSENLIKALNKYQLKSLSVGLWQVEK